MLQKLRFVPAEAEESECSHFLDAEGVLYVNCHLKDCVSAVVAVDASDEMNLHQLCIAKALVVQAVALNPIVDIVFTCGLSPYISDRPWVESFN